MSAAASDEAPVVVRVDYDFASTLCYVAKRAMDRLAPALDDIGVILVWSPVDLSALTGWARGAEVAGARRENALRVARELDVSLVMPRTWLDSRPAHAVALQAGAREPVWRERVWTAIFEEGRPLAVDDVVALAREVRIDACFDADGPSFEAGLLELDRRTRSAARQDVTGVPNFMLGEWPFGGIQTDETMLSILSRWAKRARGDAA